ncbi:MAG: FecR domain-containing protein, partial [Defluviitaleaceae bacterium]|nr:FecR domain-containing protein [Defluviitaleaceae bacterium]
MNKRFRAKWLSAFLVVLMTLGAAVPVFASDPNARTISIHTIDGSDITLSRAARTTTPRAGQRLASGNVLTTGAGSTVSFLMDGSSILEMAELSRVAVTSASRRLVLTVQSGAALVNATPQTEGRTLETRIGNVGLTVRGTMFTVEHSDYESTITMLSGYGDAGGVPLSAGSVLTIETGDDFGTVSDMDLGTLSLFALQSIYNNASYLTGVGTISTADLPNINSLMNEREAEHAQRQEQRTNNRTQAVQQAQERREPPPPPTTPAPTTPPRTQPAQQPDYEPYIPYTPTPTAPPPRFNVTVNGSHHTNPGSGSFAAGHSVTIRAGSRAGYDFAGWTGS